MNKQVKRTVQRNQRHYNTYQSDRSDHNYQQSNQTENECKRVIRSAKRKLEGSIVKNGNKRPFNSYIKSRRASRVNIGPFNVGEELISDNEGMAEALNQAFSSVFTREDTGEVPVCPSLSGSNIVEDVIFSHEIVQKKIKNFKISSSSGPEKISLKFN